MLIGYARVSTAEQDPQLQIDALRQAGCADIFVDRGVSGAAVIKPEFQKALAHANPGVDSILVWKLDRLGRSTRDLLDIVETLRVRGIGLRSLKEAMIDTTSPTGTLVFQFFSALAEYERGTTLERTMAGLTAAKQAGKRFGRPPSISDAQWAEAKPLLNGEHPRTIASVARMLGVSRQALYRRLERTNTP